MTKESWLKSLFVKFLKREPVRYWKICNKMDPSSCSNTALKITFDDHQMAEYMKEVLSPPDLFFDRNGKEHKRWGEALEFSCLDTS